MALTPDGTLLLAANNADDPPFATLFAANGDRPKSAVSITTKISVSSTIIPAGFVGNVRPAPPETSPGGGVIDDVV